MGVQTRSSVPNSPVKSKPPAAPILPHEIELPKLFILPRNPSSDARFLFLRHPRDGRKKRYFYCPRQGLFEFTKVQSTSLEMRSILFTPATCSNDDEDTGGLEIRRKPTASKSESSGLAIDRLTAHGISSGYVKKDAEFLIATPIDMIFMIVFVFVQPRPIAQSSGSRLFQSMDDLLEHHLIEDRHFQYLLETNGERIEKAMRDVCDVVDAGGEEMYRLNEKKLLELLLVKAKAVAKKGLTSSLEERFVKRALETPVLSVKREASSVTTIASTRGHEDENENLIDMSGSQSSTANSSATTVSSEVSSVSTVEEDLENRVPANVTYLQRLRTAFTFLITSYTTPQCANKLTELLSLEPMPIDFTPLDKHLDCVAALRNEALASRSLDDFSCKRSSVDDDELDGRRGEKRKRQDEEEKRKRADESRRVRELKKVDTSGMKKMSHFFAKRPLGPKTKA